VAGFKYVRLYAGPDGESHFEDAEFRYPDARNISELMALTGWNIRTNTASYDLDFHCAPRRQYIVNLSGEVEIEASDGETRRFGPGTIMLAEDTTGRGHKSKAVSSEDRVSLWLHLPGA
jgi:hypothetical protein